MKKNRIKRIIAFLLAFCICATGLCMDTNEAMAEEADYVFGGCFWKSDGIMKAEAGKTYEFLVRVPKTMKLATQFIAFDAKKVTIKVYEGKTAVPAALKYSETIQDYHWLYDMNFGIRFAQYATKGWVTEYSVVQITFAADAEYYIAFNEEFSEEPHEEIVYGGAGTATYLGEVKNTSSGDQTSTSDRPELESINVTVTAGGETAVIRVKNATEPVTYKLSKYCEGYIVVDENGVVSAPETTKAGTYSVAVWVGSKKLVCFVKVKQAVTNRMYQGQTRWSHDAGLEVVSAYYDKMPKTKGDLIVRCEYLGDGELKGIKNLKITFKDASGKKIVSYTQKSKPAFGSHPSFMIRIKKSKLQIKDADLSTAKVSCTAKILKDK